MEISIIIPFYNAENYIKECLESIFFNNESNIDKFEVILVNDGSTDQSLEICKEYISKYNNIKIYCNSNHGVSYCRNYGIRCAKGTWIMFVDADDKLSDNWLQIIKKNMNNLFEIMVFSKEKVVISDTSIIERIIGTKPDIYNLKTPWSKIYKKDFLKRSNIKFNEKIINGEDLLFNLNIFLESQKYLIVNDSIYLYRTNFSSATKRYDDKIKESDLIFQEKLVELLKHYNFNEQEITIFREFCMENALITFLQRMAYSYPLMKFLKESRKFKDYSVNIEKYKNLSKIKKLIIKLYKWKLYGIIYFIFNIHKYKALKKDDSIVEI